MDEYYKKSLPQKMAFTSHGWAKKVILSVLRFPLGKFSTHCGEFYNSSSPNIYVYLGIIMVVNEEFIILKIDYVSIDDS